MKDVKDVQLIGDWVSPQEAAEYIGVSKQTVRALWRSGKLIGAKVGYRTLRISTVSIEKMMEKARRMS